VADQFLTCKLRNMRSGDVQYGCVLDVKGYMLDDLFVYMTDESIEILTSGFHSTQLFDYISQYAVYVRRSGADVVATKSKRTVTLALQGPRACEALMLALEQLENSATPLQLEMPIEERTPVLKEVLADMPYMSFFHLRSGSRDKGGAALLRIGSTGEDGFEIVAPPGDLVKRLAETLIGMSPLVRPAGAYCHDILRLEAGMPRIDIDVEVGRMTPVTASLAWTLDQGKMRNHLLFGWDRLLRSSQKVRENVVLLWSWMDLRIQGAAWFPILTACRSVRSPPQLGVQLCKCVSPWHM